MLYVIRFLLISYILDLYRFEVPNGKIVSNYRRLFINELFIIDIYIILPLIGVILIRIQNHFQSQQNDLVRRCNSD